MMCIFVSILSTVPSRLLLQSERDVSVCGGAECGVKQSTANRKGGEPGERQTGGGGGGGRGGRGGGEKGNQETDRQEGGGEERLKGREFCESLGNSLNVMRV